MKKKVIGFLAVGILFAALGAYFGSKQFAPAPAESRAVENLYAQTLPDVNGNPESLTKWKNKTLLVNFWATWCAPCVEEMPELVELQRDLEQRNAQVIGIGIDSAESVARFASTHRITTYPLYVAGINGTELSRQFGNEAGGLPYTVLIGADGKIKKTYLGRLKMEQVRKDLGLD